MTGQALLHDSAVLEIFSVDSYNGRYRFVIRKHEDGAITLSQFKRRRDNTFETLYHKKRGGTES